MHYFISVLNKYLISLYLKDLALSTDYIKYYIYLF